MGVCLHHLRRWRHHLHLAYAAALSRMRLRNVDRVGCNVRVLGQPRIENDGYMAIGDGVVIDSRYVPSELCTALQTTLRIGEGTYVGYGTSIGVAHAVHIGKNVRIGPYCMIIDTDFHDIYERGKRPPPKAVTIEDGVWIGAKASVLRGVTIGSGAIIGVGAVVNRSVEPHSVVMGVPAKPMCVQGGVDGDAGMLSGVARCG